MRPFTKAHDRPIATLGVPNCTVAPTWLRAPPEFVNENGLRTERVAESAEMTSLQDEV
jgi:hypothetical protein